MGVLDFKRRIARSDTKVFAHSKLFATDKRAAAAANSDLYYDNTIAKNKQGGQWSTLLYYIV